MPPSTSLQPLLLEQEAERKAENQETVIQQNRMSKLHTENFDYADLNSNYWEAVQFRITRGIRLKPQQTQEQIQFQSILPMPSGIWHYVQWSSSHGTEKVHIAKKI